MRRAAALALALLAGCGKASHDQAHAKGHLGALRSALSIYYGDAQGRYPRDLEELIPKQLAMIPALEIPDHAPTSARRVVRAAPSAEAGLSDSGRWLYFSSGPLDGTVLIDCTHTDANGRRWSEF